MKIAISDQKYYVTLKLHNALTDCNDCGIYMDSEYPNLYMVVNNTNMGVDIKITGDGKHPLWTLCAHIDKG